MNRRIPALCSPGIFSGVGSKPPGAKVMNRVSAAGKICAQARQSHFGKVLVAVGSNNRNYSASAIA
jgi:hypothetical protein